MILSSVIITYSSSSSNNTSNRSDGTGSANDNGDDMVDSENTNRSEEGNNSVRESGSISTSTHSSHNHSSQKSNRGGYLKGGRRIPLGKRLSKHSLSHRWDLHGTSINKKRTLSEGKSCDYGSTSAVGLILFPHIVIILLVLCCVVFAMSTPYYFMCSCLRLDSVLEHTCYDVF